MSGEARSGAAIAALATAGLVTILHPSDLFAEEGTKPMAEDVMIEWTKVGTGSEGAADVRVLEDGRVRLSPRLGGGEHRLSNDDLRALRRFVFDQQRFQEIEADALKREVGAAAERRRDRDTSDAAFVPAPQMDAGTTVIRANLAGAAHEVTYFDLVGDAQTYPEVEALQRLRRIELEMLRLSTRSP